MKILNKLRGDHTMKTISLEQEKLFIENKLQERELNHLKVTKRGVNIAIYSEDEKGKDNRCRFTYIRPGVFILNMANHTGRWEPTPFEGSIEELLKMVIEQFPWTITNYDEFNI